ncbi:MAG: hypothetical protein FJW34_27040, partial [Acidobacteria bacterium]|nr:hypothetical protein [Acidobacteriota bacterium]
MFNRARGLFRPNYQVTERILNNITRATASKELIHQLHLPREWLANFRREALVRSAHASAALEGNPLSYAQASRIVIERHVDADEEQKRQ